MVSISIFQDPHKYLQFVPQDNSEQHHTFKIEKINNKNYILFNVVSDVSNERLEYYGGLSGNCDLTTASNTSKAIIKY